MMFSVDHVMPPDDRDVLAFDPVMGIVVACYIQSKGWVHGFEPLYKRAGIPHIFRPTHWYYLDVIRPDER